MCGLKKVIREDRNLFCVGFAMDALSRLANVGPEGEDLPSAVIDLQADLVEVLGESPVQSWEALVRAGLDGLGSP